MAIEQDITRDDNFFAGEAKVLQFTIYKEDDVTPQPLAGWTIEWVLDGHHPLRVTKRSDGAGGITITDAPNGECEVLLTHEDTADWLNGTYAHEMRRVDPGSESVLVFGKAVLRRLVL